MPSYEHVAPWSPIRHWPGPQSAGPPLQRGHAETPDGGGSFPPAMCRKGGLSASAEPRPPHQPQRTRGAVRRRCACVRIQAGIAVQAHPLPPCRLPQQHKPPCDARRVMGRTWHELQTCALKHPNLRARYACNSSLKICERKAGKFARERGEGKGQRRG